MSPTIKFAIQFVITAIELACPLLPCMNNSLTKNHGIEPKLRRVDKELSISNRQIDNPFQKRFSLKTPLVCELPGPVANETTKARTKIMHTYEAHP